VRKGRGGRRRRGLGRLAIAAIAGIVVLGTAAPALGADPYPAGDKQPPQVLGEHFFNNSQPAAASAGPAAGGGDQGGIAFTGIDLLIMVLTALAALAIGFLLWRSPQNRPVPPSD
jgi:hypothetical protein